MRRFDVIIFDLDGTLADTGPGIIETLKHVLSEHGLPDEPDSELEKFIGPPLKDSFIRYYGMDERKAKQLQKEFREYYATGPIYNAQLYPGITKALDRLFNSGRTLKVATNKPQIYAERLLTHLGIRDYFTDVCGPTLLCKKSKTSLILKCIGKTDPKRCLMVGDTVNDAKAAEEAGVAFVLAEYGYGKQENFTQIQDPVIAFAVNAGGLEIIDFAF